MLLGDPCYSDLVPTSDEAKILLLDHNWGLSKTIVNTPAVNLNYVPTLDLQTGGWTHSLSELSSNAPETDITYILARLEAALIIEIAVEDSTKPEGTELTLPTKFFDKFCVTVSSAEQLGIHTPVFSPWRDTANSRRDSWTLTYHSGTTVVLTAASRPGYDFVRWSTASGYTYDSLSHLTLNVSVSDQPLKVRAIYRKLFMIESITLGQDTGFAGHPSGITYETTGENATIATCKTENWCGPSDDPVVIAFHFNNPVDPASVWKNINCLQYNWRIDNHVLNTYSTYIGSNAWLSVDGKTVTWYVRSVGTPKVSSGVQKRTFGTGSIVAADELCKLQTALVTLNSSVLSVSGAHLQNPINFEIKTIAPDITWTVRNVQEYGHCDYSNNADDFPYYGNDMYLSSPFWYNDRGGVLHQGDLGLSPPHSYYEDMNCDDSVVFARRVCTLPRIKDDQIVYLAVNGLDVDDGHMADRLGDFTWAGWVTFFGLGGISFLLDDLGETELADGIGALVGGFVLVAALLITGIWEIFDGNHDDNLGQVDFLGFQANFWGLKNFVEEPTGNGERDARIKVKLEVTAN